MRPSTTTKKRSYFAWATSGLVVLLASGVFAQGTPAPTPTPAPAPTAPAPAPDPAPAPAPDPAPAPAPGADVPTGTAPADENKTAGADADVDVSFKQQAKISPSEMIDQGKQYISEMEDILKRIVQLQEIAKKQADVIKLNCVNDKLLQIKELVNIGEGAMTNIHESVARNDDDERYHQYSRLSISHQKGQAVGQDAENCIGEDLTFVGETDVGVEVDPNIPGTDPLDPVGGEPIVVERPPLASQVN